MASSIFRLWKTSKRTVLSSVLAVITGIIINAATSACRPGNKAVAVPATASGASFSNDLGMTFVYIPAGAFMMGSPEDEPYRENDERRHKVKITRGFYMQTTEVTQGQWQAVMGGNPSDFKDCGDHCPVEQVSWDDVQEFIGELNRKTGRTYRLPTEAEWEYACRAGTTGPFNTGDCLSVSQANYDGDYPFSGCPEEHSRRKTVAVKSFAPNARGLYDMHGNVWEWCNDWYGETFPMFRNNDPVGPSSGENRIFRGGGWSSGARGCRSADRNRRPPDFYSNFIGFRLAADQ